MKQMLMQTSKHYPLFIGNGIRHDAKSYDL